MIEHIMCSMLKKEDVKLSGNTISFTFSSEIFEFFLSEEALDMIRDELNRRRDYEMNDVRKQRKEANL